MTVALGDGTRVCTQPGSQGMANWPPTEDSMTFEGTREATLAYDSCHKLRAGDSVVLKSYPLADLRSLSLDFAPTVEHHPNFGLQGTPPIGAWINVKI